VQAVAQAAAQKTTEEAADDATASDTLLLLDSPHTQALSPSLCEQVLEPGALTGKCPTCFHTNCSVLNALSPPWPTASKYLCVDGACLNLTGRGSERFESFPFTRVLVGSPGVPLSMVLEASTMRGFEVSLV
jgi:hypothetical protein